MARKTKRAPLELRSHALLTAMGKYLQAKKWAVGVGGPIMIVRPSPAKGPYHYQLVIDFTGNPPSEEKK